MKLQAIRKTKAHLLIQIVREHHVQKINYSMHKVQVSYFVELPQYLTLGHFLDFYLSQIPWTFQGFQKFRKSGTL